MIVFVLLAFLKIQDYISCTLMDDSFCGGSLLTRTRITLLTLKLELTSDYY